jgi:DNA-binding transcriptional ArsR family regulator
VELKLGILREKVLDFQGLTNLAPPSWRIDGILPSEGLAVLYGHPGTFKSFVALDWAHCVATGCSWKGCEVVQGFVLYIIAESPAGMSLRAKAWEKVNQLTPVTIRFLPVAVNLLDPEWAQALAVLADELGADLSVVDTLSRTMVGANENAPESMTLAVDNADKLRREHGATVLVHHKPRDGVNPRGHTALEGAVDTMIEVAAGDGGIILHSRKAKNAETFADISLTPTPVQLGEMSDSLSNSLVLDVGQTGLDKTENEQRLSNALSNVFTLTGASVSELEQATGLSRSSVYFSLNRLLEARIVTKQGRGRYVMNDGRDEG